MYLSYVCPVFILFDDLDYMFICIVTLLSHFNLPFSFIQFRILRPVSWVLYGLTKIYFCLILKQGKELTGIPA
jgi:hypothetical protein